MYILIGLIFSMILINAWPLWTGNLFEEDYRIKEIPSYWYDAADWLNSLHQNFTYFCLPQQTFSIYTWGKTLGDERNAFFDANEITMRPVVSGNSPESTALIDYLYDGISKNSSQDFGRILGLMNVEYILQRNDINWTFYDFIDSPSHIKSVLSSQNGISLEKTFGELDFYKVNYTNPQIYASSNAVYVEGGIDYLAKLAAFHEFPLFSSALFFSDVMPEQNGSTLPLANQVAYTSIYCGNWTGANNSGTIFYDYPVELKNSEDSTVRFEHNNVGKGKFFASGARGYIDAVKVYAKNNEATDGALTLGFAQFPGGPELFERVVAVPAASTGWFNATVDRFWDFDSIFIYVKSDSAWVGIDYYRPDLWDDYYSNSSGWFKFADQGRRYISLEYTKTQEVCRPIGSANDSNAIFYDYPVELKNSEDSTVRFEHNNVGKGKFFASGARGYIDAVKVYAKNNEATDGALTLGFAQFPGGPELFERVVAVPAASTGWFNATVDRFWDFDSIFIYVKSDSAWVGIDYYRPDLWDDYYSNSSGWFKFADQGRRYISLEYTRRFVVNSISTDSNLKSPEVQWQEINPTKYIVDVNAETPFFIVFSQMYHVGWRAYVDRNELDAHFLANGYANSWYVNRTGTFKITIEYAPQQNYDYAKTTSFVTAVVLILLAVLSSSKALQKRLLRIFKRGHSSRSILNHIANAKIGFSGEKNALQK